MVVGGGGGGGGGDLLVFTCQTPKECSPGKELCAHLLSVHYKLQHAGD